MLLADFEYDLPSDRIALKPVEKRDQSRLMRLIRSSGEISHYRFSDLPDLLHSSDLIVLNNTKVFPARLLGQRKGITSGRLVKEVVSNPRLRCYCYGHWTKMCGKFLSSREGKCGLAKESALEMENWKQKYWEEVLWALGQLDSIIQES